MTERVVRVKLDVSGVAQGERRARGIFRRFQGEARKTSRAVDLIKRAAGGLAAAFTVRELGQQLNAYQELQNRLRIVTDGTQNLSDVTEELFEVSQRTRGSFEGVVDLYSRVARSTEELGVSQRETLEFTEAVSQAIAVSGASAQEAAAGIVQLGQGLASGGIRGDELRSVLENLPGLAREIAAGLGVTIGELRTLGSEGALTAESVFAAVQARAANIRADFEELTPTIGQSIQVLKNSVLGFVGTLDEATGAGDQLAEFVLTLSEGVDFLAKALTGTLEPGDEVSETFRNITIGIIAAGAALDGLLGILGVVKGAFVDFGEALGGILAAGGAALEGEFSQAGRILQEAFSDPLDDSQAAAADFFEDFAKTIDDTSLKINDVLLPSFRAVNDEVSTIGEGSDTNLEIDLGAGKAAAELEKLQEARASFLADLDVDNEALRRAAETGQDYAEALEDVKLEKLAAGDPEFLATAEAEVELNRQLTEEVERQVEAQEALADLKEERGDVLAELEQEAEALRLAADEGIAFADALERIKLIELFGEDSEGLAAALSLREANDNLREELDETEDILGTFFDQARRNAQDILAGFLADPLAEGLDELPGKFAKVLQELAAQALAAEIFEILGSLGGGGSAEGGFINALIGAFGGGRQSGGTVSPDRSFLVGEAGPELFVPPTGGQIVPNSQMAPNVQVGGPTIVNAVDADSIVAAGLGSNGQVILNQVTEEREAFRNALGIT